MTPSPFEQSFAQWPRTGDTGLADCAERGSMTVCGGWRQRRKGLDCTGYITRHSWLSPMRFNARSRTSTAIHGKVSSAGFRLLFLPSLCRSLRTEGREPVAYLGISEFSSFHFQVSHLSFIIHQVPCGVIWFPCTCRKYETA